MSGKFSAETAGFRSYLAKLGSVLEALDRPARSSSIFPKELHLELTYRCNLDCVMCNLKFRRQGPAEADSSKLIESLGESRILSDVGFIVLSGGEPWMKNGFYDIVDFLARKLPRAKILVLTNLYDSGAALELASRLLRSPGPGRAELGTSLDGIGADHDRVRGKTGAYDRLLENVCALKTASPGLPVFFNFTLTPSNAGALPAVFAAAFEKKLKISYQLMVPKAELTGLEFPSRTASVVNEGINDIIAFVLERHEFGIRRPEDLEGRLELMFELLNLQYMHKYLMKKERFFSRCVFSDSVVAVNPAGELYFCPVYKDLTGGNAVGSGFDAAFLSERSQSAKRFLAGGGCSCWLSCSLPKNLPEIFFSNRKLVAELMSKTSTEAT